MYLIASPIFPNTITEIRHFYHRPSASFGRSPLCGRRADSEGRAALCGAEGAADAVAASRWSDGRPPGQPGGRPGAAEDPGPRGCYADQRRPIMMFPGLTLGSLPLFDLC